MNLKNVELAEIPSIAKKILNEYSQERIFVFDAPMGAGKTTLITQMCQALGVGDEVASPSFAIVNVYLGKDSKEIYHFDFYRLEKIEDAFEIGFYEYFDSGNYCFIEWPDLIEAHLPERYVKIKIVEKDDPNLRDIVVRAFS